MHHTTLTYLQTARAFDKASFRDADYFGEASEQALIEWRAAGYPDADPEPANAPSLDALARAVAPLETSPLAGGADLRAELDAARAKLTKTAAERDAARAEADHWRGVAEDRAVRPDSVTAFGGGWG